MPKPGANAPAFCVNRVPGIPSFGVSPFAPGGFANVTGNVSCRFVLDSWLDLERLLRYINESAPNEFQLSSSQRFWLTPDRSVDDFIAPWMSTLTELHAAEATFSAPLSTPKTSLTAICSRYSKSRSTKGQRWALFRTVVGIRRMRILDIQAASFKAFVGTKY